MSVRGCCGRPPVGFPNRVKEETAGITRCSYQPRLFHKRRDVGPLCERRTTRRFSAGSNQLEWWATALRSPYTRSTWKAVVSRSSGAGFMKRPQPQASVRLAMTRRLLHTRNAVTHPAWLLFVPSISELGGPGHFSNAWRSGRLRDVVVDPLLMLRSSSAVETAGDRSKRQRRPALRARDEQRRDAPVRQRLGLRAPRLDDFLWCS